MAPISLVNADYLLTSRPDGRCTFAQELEGRLDVIQQVPRVTVDDLGVEGIRRDEADIHVEL